MTRTLLALLAAVPLLVPSAALAQRQYIDVGSPDFRPLAIAVVPFQSGPGAQADAVDVQLTFRDDLSLTGIFDLLDARSFLADASEGTQASTIKFRRWSDVGAEGLVKAAVKREGALVAGELHLYDVRAGREVLYRVYRERTARALAHRFADDVLQYYTREPGVFRTRIAAIRKTQGAWDIVLLDADGKGAETLRRETAIALLPSWRSAIWRAAPSTRPTGGGSPSPRRWTATRTSTWPAPTAPGSGASPPIRPPTPPPPGRRTAGESPSSPAARATRTST
jgi:TolB protein